MNSSDANLIITPVASILWRIVLAMLVVALTTLPAKRAFADATESFGHIEVIQPSGQKHFLPTVSSQYEVEIAGDLATITLTQRFENDLDRTVHARYLFPLNKDAAVFAMQMVVGDERVEAKIDRIEEAKKTFEQAKSEGKSAALMQQYRPNVFTQQIANLTPAAPITVTLRYVQTIPRIDQRYGLVLPLVVGPRYRNRATTKASVPDQQDVDSTDSFSRWELIALPESPQTIIESAAPDNANSTQRGGDVDILIRLNSKLTVSKVTSDSHPIVTQKIDENTTEIALADSQTLANRDFRLYYQLAAPEVSAGVLSHRDERGGFFSVLIEAPVVTLEESITPREMVFVLDCSGSMSGDPLNASKMFMRKALRKLRPTDRFRIIRFSDSATEFSQTPLLASPENIALGLRYVNSLNGSGGTEMSSGIIQALIQPGEEGVMRIISFLTDGYIGDDAGVLELINTHLGNSRLMALGVGTAPNRYLLSEMGRIGRGITRYLDPADDADAVTTDLVDRLQSPVLTDIGIDWKGLQPTEIYPSKIPDLFAGQSVRIQGRYEQPGQFEINVKGNIRGAAAELPIQADLPAEGGDGEAIGLIWARAAIADRMRKLTVAQSDGDDTDFLKEAVVKLGLDFSLVTRWTAFVAVSEKIHNTDTENTDNLDVANHQVVGVARTAYPQNQSFVGHGTPEPQTLFGLLIVLGGSLLYFSVLPRLRLNSKT